MGLTFDNSQLENGLRLFESRATVAVRMYAETAALQLQNQAKMRAPWTDRTGAARGRLNSYVTAEPSSIRIWLAHGVDYGIWLELAHEKHFAIIQPTIDLQSPQILRGLDHLLDRIKIF